MAGAALAMGRGGRALSVALKLALVAYFLYVVLVRPGLPWYAYPVIGVVILSAYRVVTRDRTDFRLWWVYLAGALLFTQLWFLADESGATVRFRYVMDLDRLLLGGEVPTAWLQERLYVDGRRGALEWALIVVYTSYFFAPHLVAVLLWRRAEHAFRTYVTAYVALLFVGLAVFAAAPTAPPWMAAQEGRLPAVSRIILETASGFSPTFYERSYEAALGNAVAAMPSVHMGVTMLIALVAWRSGRTGLKLAGVAYLLVMAFALVYLGEHYVVDLLAGAAVAAGAWWASAAWWGRRDARAAAAPAASHARDQLRA